MGEDAKQWSGAALAIAAMLCMTVLLIVHPTIISSEAVSALYVCFGLRATGLISHVFRGAPTDGEGKK